jgi:outer membrane receptor protein involved in Fe transport
MNYDWTPRNLLYVNVSQGYKGGSYPTIPMLTYTQARPVVQERLLAYEVGFKSALFDRQLQINGAAFHYDYTDKQILGFIYEPVFGPTNSLVNVPQSHVDGFELTAVYSPNWLQGLTIAPAVSNQHSRLDRSRKNVCTTDIVSALASEGLACVPGDFYNYDSFGQIADYTGEKFPSAPEWQASVDGEYDWRLRDNLTVFFGGHVQYTSPTNSAFVNRTPLQPEGAYNLEGIAPDGSYNHPNDPLYVKAYTLVDLRAGIQKGDWQLQVWGHNVFNTYYWTGSYAQSDVLIRYTGMPTTYGVTLSVNL